jgi:mRNA interferase RelE/StbE
MPYIIVVENRAQKEFVKLPDEAKLPIQKAISSLEFNPRSPAVKKLAGTRDGYRLRSGDYRVLFVLGDRQKIITVYRIRHRKDAY